MPFLWFLFQRIFYRIDTLQIKCNYRKRKLLGQNKSCAIYTWVTYIEGTAMHAEGMHAGDESVKIDKRGSREHCGSARRVRIRSALPPRLIVTCAIRRRGTDYWQTPCERMHLTGVFVVLFGPYLPCSRRRKPEVPSGSLCPAAIHPPLSSTALHTYSLRFDSLILRCLAR